MKVHGVNGIHSAQLDQQYIMSNGGAREWPRLLVVTLPVWSHHGVWADKKAVLVKWFIWLGDERGWQERLCVCVVNSGFGKLSSSQVYHSFCLPVSFSLSLYYFLNSSPLSLSFSVYFSPSQRFSFLLIPLSFFHLPLNGNISHLFISLFSVPSMFSVLLWRRQCWCGLFPKLSQTPIDWATLSVRLN